MNSIELFAGAGGLAMGVAQAGFRHRAIVECNRWACNSVRENTLRAQSTEEESGLGFLKHWPDPHQTDIRSLRYEDLGEPIHLVSGGPPCQPFSLGGKHQAQEDSRDMFPEAARAVRELQPAAFIFENVRGLLRQSFAQYFEYVHLRLSYPELVARGTDSWMDHLSRLEKHHTSSGAKGLAYNVVYRVLNAADHGVPQNRDRIILVGFRADLGIEWSFPDPTHSRDRLLWDQWVSGEYWDEHRVSKARRKNVRLSRRDQARVERMRSETEPLGSRWRTVRDALMGLPDPEYYPKRADRFLNHFFQPGARSYPGHSGSPLDMPSKTLKAGVHGVPGGENMMVREDGSLRYFSVREAARLQTFPDAYALEGAWSEAMRQLGNAVPVALARTIAEAVAASLGATSASLNDAQTNVARK